MKEEKQKKLIVTLAVITAVWAGFAAIGLYGRYGRGNSRSAEIPVVTAGTVREPAIPQTETPSVEGVYVEEPPVPKGFDPAGIFSISKSKVGDVINGMRVVSIGPRRFGDVGEYNLDDLHVVFSGETVLTGEYHVFFNDWNLKDEVGFDVTGKERDRLPRLENDKGYDTGFCFTNSDYAKKFFGPVNSHGTATVVIDGYEINRYPSEGSCDVRFVKLISIERDK